MLHILSKDSWLNFSCLLLYSVKGNPSNVGIFLYIFTFRYILESLRFSPIIWGGGFFFFDILLSPFLHWYLPSVPSEGSPTTIVMINIMTPSITKQEWDTVYEIYELNVLE